MAVNPLMNPVLNPYLNPLATQGSQPMPAGTAAMYFLAAQQMSGGLGSGRLNGPQAPSPAGNPARNGRPGYASRTQGGPGSGRGADAESRRGGANSPGGTAARYFDRDYPTKLNNTGYYSRPNRHFPSPGK
jgi:hypothetical protein